MSVKVSKTGILSVSYVKPWRQVQNIPPLILGVKPSSSATWQELHKGHERFCKKELMGTPNSTANDVAEM